ncbi:hypothetical protein [Bacillus phage vB_BanS-Thrax4]|nr:hypothetical protein [Bacillus phage vB_BanS-Thrax4]
MTKEWLKQFEGKTIKEITADGYEMKIQFEETKDILFVQGEHEFVGIDVDMIKSGEEFDCIYKVVGGENGVEMFMSIESLTKQYEQIGTTEGDWLHKALQGQPRLKGLCGAFHDGMDGEYHVIRYETPEVYDALSR